MRELATRGRDRGAKKKEWPGYYGTRRLLAHEKGRGPLLTSLVCGVPAAGLARIRLDTLHCDPNPGMCSRPGPPR